MVLTSCPNICKFSLNSDKPPYLYAKTANFVFRKIKACLKMSAANLERNNTDRSPFYWNSHIRVSAKKQW